MDAYGHAWLRHTDGAGADPSSQGLRMTEHGLSSDARWLTPDPGGRNVVHLDNPQTWNMYSYVTNNPTTLNDPLGLQQQATTPKDCGTVSTDCGPNNVSTQKQARKDTPLKQAAKGGLKIAIGVGLIATAAGGDVPGGIAGALLVSSEGLGGLTLGVSGTLDVAGAASKTDVSKGQEALDATGNLAGLAVTALSGGNLHAGSEAATMSDVATLSVSPREAMRNPATAADAVRTAVSAAQLLHSYWNNFKEALPSLPVFF